MIRSMEFKIVAQDTAIASELTVVASVEAEAEALAYYQGLGYLSKDIEHKCLSFDQRGDLIVFTSEDHPFPANKRDKGSYEDVTVISFGLFVTQETAKRLAEIDALINYCSRKQKAYEADIKFDTKQIINFDAHGLRGLRSVRFAVFFLYLVLLLGLLAGYIVCTVFYVILPWDSQPFYLSILMSFFAGFFVFFLTFIIFSKGYIGDFNFCFWKARADIEEASDSYKHDTLCAAFYAKSIASLQEERAELEPKPLVV
jgi:hypothetical protein